jgi:hypothetical protein
VALSERSQATRKGIIAQELVRRALKAKKGPPCDIVTPLGAFELYWGRTTKNGPSLAHDRARAKLHGGCCVQIAGAMSPAYRRAGDISLYELLKMHGVSEPAAKAAAIRRAAEEIA